MSIIGIDFGAYTSYVAGIKDGTVEVFANEYSLLATPTAVAYNAKPRPIGVSARQLVVAKSKSTVAFFKPLLRRNVESHGRILDAIPCETTAVDLKSKDKYATVKVYDENNTAHTYAIQQVLGTYITKLFGVAKAATGTHVEECFMTVPYYFTVSDRQVILEAAKIAGVPFIKLINETAALAASYAFFKKATLPAANETPKKVVFVDVGYSQAQISVADVHKEGAKVLLARHSTEVGGFFFDDVIRGYFADVFQQTKKLDARANRKAWLRLADEAEKAKKSMSAASTKLFAQVECLMEDTDFKAEIDRTLFEELAAPLFKAFEKLVIDFLNEANLNIAEVDVELVGGSSRIPALRAIVERLFQHEAKTTMNLDEAIVRGTTLMAGLLSPRVRKANFTLEDFVPETVIARYTNNGQQKTIALYKRGETIPNRKNLTVFTPEVDLFYESFGTSPRPDLLHIAHVNAAHPIEPNQNAVEPTKFRIPFVYELDHLLHVNNIMRIDKVLQPEEPAPEPQAAAPEQPAEGAAPPPAPEANAAPATPPKPAGPPQPKVQETRIDAFFTHSDGVEQVKQEYIDAEKALLKLDADAEAKAEAMNAYEAYFYDVRGQVEETPALFIPEKMADLLKVLDQVDQSLYDDDEGLTAASYHEKLNALKKFVNESSLQQSVKIEEVPETEPMDVDQKQPPTAV
uniref:Hsp70 protein-domain-containing protein n=1 Tax=Panagrellus redivivus TaxID=6233 RepID=A0A7E4ZW65_PANRE